MYLFWFSFSDKNITPSATHTGKSADIKCPYPDSHVNNTKYLCKGETPLKCEELIQTTEGERQVAEGRFSIRDNRRLNNFNVNIQHLSTADSGTYWCGSDRKWHNAAFTKVNLSIGEYSAEHETLQHSFCTKRLSKIIWLKYICAGATFTLSLFQFSVR